MAEDESRRPDFLAELKRRHVVRVALVYGAVAFAVLQAADLLVPALQLPSVLVTIVAVLAILGFPIALVLAWVFELTAQGVRRTAAVDGVDAVAGDARGATARWVSVRTVAIVAGALLVTATTAWFAGRLSARGGESARALTSVAVLPFANVGDDPANQYFSDGLAEQLLTELMRVEGLKVAARASAFAFRDQARDIRDVARQLGVASIVQGSVQRQNERVRVRAQLVQASDGFNIWSQSYDGELADVFALQDSLAQAIAGALRFELGLEGRSRRQRGLTEDIAAYDLYLLGRHHFGLRTRASLQDAIGHYEAAIARDSTFALAYAGLAEAHLIHPFYDFARDFAEVADVARPLVQRAVALSPERAEVQAAAGVLALYGDWDFARSLEHLGRAEQLAPSYHWTYHYRRQTYAALGRYDEALRDAYRAIELDPLSGIILGGGLALVLSMVDSLEASARAYARSMENWEPAPFVLSLYGDLLARLGRVAEAESMFVRWARSIGYARPGEAAVLAHAFESDEHGRRITRLLESVVATTPLRRADLVLEYRLGEPEAALRAVTEAVEQRHYWSLLLGVEDARPGAQALQNDPRYIALIERVRPRPAHR